MTSISMLIPFASGEPWRLRARDHTVGWYRALGYDVVEGACLDPWRKAVAAADAAQRTDAKTLAVVDADCLCAGIAAAHAAVDASAGWAVPHTLVHRLDQAATETVYAGAHPASTTGRTQRPYRGFAGGGIVVLPRATWERVPLDPRFEGWGGEDSSWALALTTLVGPPARFDHDLFHLFHPPADRMTRRWGCSASRALEIRYKRATKNRRQMADLVAEAAPAPIGAT